ncbi:hypothetical protein EW145_g100 [Phellinidium pouzarii]|uniref:Uncharacterized protein n=1 Tax=Phellinidium pouzarii TaxID=167371 RepID=A0A4S4LK50_9AGAM|nr:hypothetical protein EW145_g100 [Phellinidium pouzarii]
MSNLKRTRSQMDDSDDEPTMGKQILPVARLPDNFDGEPMDGMQYLFTVRRDARKLPNFTRVENPFSIECAKMETPDAPATDRARVVLPSEEWRTVFLTRFKNFRKNSAQATIGVALPPSSRRSKIMPEKKERDNWWAFINGRPECEWNPPKKHRKPWQETNSHAESMHSWENGTSDLSQYEVSYTNDAPESEALVVNEYGEIEEDMNDIDMEIEAEEISAVDSLPTPFATPQPESRYKSSNFAPELQNVQTQRKLGGKLQQPTPTLLKGMDSVNI